MRRAAFGLRLLDNYAASLRAQPRNWSPSSIEKADRGAGCSGVPRRSALDGQKMPPQRETMALHRLIHRGIDAISPNQRS